jgi:hypothetical protein
MLLIKALSMENDSLHRNKGSTNKSEGSLVVLLLLFEIMLIRSALLWTSKVYNCTIHDRIDVVFNKVIRKVKKRRHWNPLFGHIGDEISKNRKKKVHWASSRGHETQLSTKIWC